MSKELTCNDNSYRETVKHCEGRSSEHIGISSLVAQRVKPTKTL